MACGGYGGEAKVGARGPSARTGREGAPRPVIPTALPCSAYVEPDAVAFRTRNSAPVRSISSAPLSRRVRPAGARRTPRAAAARSTRGSGARSRRRTCLRVPGRTPDGSPGKDPDRPRLSLYVQRCTPSFLDPPEPPHRQREHPRGHEHPDDDEPERVDADVLEPA